MRPTVTKITATQFTGLVQDKMLILKARNLSILLAALVFTTYLLCVASPAQAAENPLLKVIHSQSNQIDRKRNAPIARFTRGKDLKGWEHIANRLLDYGLEPERIVSLFSDSRMPKREHLYFSVTPRESRALYRGHNTVATRKNALRFYQEHKTEFKRASRQYGVPESVILAILQIETRCGAYTGNHPVLYRLARLASASDPETIAANQKRYRIRDASVSPMKVAQRARWLENTFLPHAVATITLADRLEVDPFEIKGSSAGALGLPQFLPGNIEVHGADGNGDGRVDLFQPEDAIHSVARFLVNHGWQPSTRSYESQKEVILHYNRSDSYAETVLAMARRLAASLS